MINVGIIGATGYSGEELINILLEHPEVRITYLASRTKKGIPVADIFPRFKNRTDLCCHPFNIDKAISKADLFFLALPHTSSMRVVPKLLKANKKVIDLSADYRLKNKKVYEKFYNTKHVNAVNIKNAIYGLPELYRAKIKQANLVANPGCYSTAAILALAPLISCSDIKPQDITIDAKSGATGAGRRAMKEYFFSEINEDAYAYKINVHQHIPEINQELSKLSTGPINVTFVPHLLSLNRGILETIYIRCDRKQTLVGQKLVELYKRFYKKEPFLRIKKEGESIRIKDVANTNFCDIAIKVFAKQKLIVLLVAIDNLGKGAASQAVQNMNIVCGLPERTALV